MCERCDASEKVIDDSLTTRTVIHLDDADREEIEKIVTEKIKEALGSGGLINDAMQMDERFVYVGKEVYALKNDIKKLREDLC
jgi:hypothetical protein